MHTVYEHLLIVKFTKYIHIAMIIITILCSFYSERKYYFYIQFNLPGSKFNRNIFPSSLVSHHLSRMT